MVYRPVGLKHYETPEQIRDRAIAEARSAELEAVLSQVKATPPPLRAGQLFADYAVLWAALASRDGARRVIVAPEVYLRMRESGLLTVLTERYPGLELTCMAPVRGARPAYVIFDEVADYGQS